MDVNNLEKLKRPQLQQLCKKFGLKASGKNTVLIEALKKQVAQQRGTPTSTPSKSPKQAAAKQAAVASKWRRTNAATALPSPRQPAALPDAGKAVPATKRGGRRGRPPKGKKSPVVSPARVNGSPRKSPVISPARVNGSPRKSPVISPAQVNGSPRKSFVVSPARVNGSPRPSPVISPAQIDCSPRTSPVVLPGQANSSSRKSPVVSPFRVRNSRSVSSGDVVVVEASPLSDAASSGGGGNAGNTKSTTRGRRARRPKASAGGADDDAGHASLATLQSTKRRRSEVGTSPLASPKRSRAVVSAVSPLSQSPSKRMSLVVAKCSPVSDLPAKSDAPAANSKATAKGGRHSRASSNASAAARPNPKVARPSPKVPQRRGSPLTTQSKSKTASPVVARTTPNKARRATRTASPLLKSTSRADISVVLKSPVVSITRSPRTSPQTSRTVEAAPVKRSVRNSSSAEKKRKVVSKPSSRVVPGRRTRASSSPKETTRGRGSASPNKFSPANGDLLSPPSLEPTRRGTFTVSPSSVSSTEPGPRKRTSEVLSTASRDTTPSPAGSSPGVSIDVLKASILADLNQKVASKLPPAIPIVGSSSSLSAGGKGKKTATGKDWASIHKKTFSRMKSIEDEVRERQARRNKAAANPAPTASTASRVLKAKPKNVPVFQIPDKNKKLVFAFGGKPPSATTTTTTTTTTAKATKPPAVPAAVTKAAPVSSVSRAGSHLSVCAAKPRVSLSASKPRVSLSAAKPRVSISAARTPMKPDDRRTSAANSALNFSFASPGFKSPAAPKPKFDLKASLQRQLTYKPYVGPLNKSSAGNTLKPSAISRLKSPSVKVFRQRGSPAKEFKRPPIRNRRVESRQNMQQRLKSQRSDAAMANRGLVC